MECKGFVYIFSNENLGKNYCLVGYCENISEELNRLSEERRSKCEIIATFAVHHGFYISNETVFDYFDRSNIKHFYNVLFTDTYTAFDLLLKSFHKTIHLVDIKAHDKTLQDKAKRFKEKQCLEDLVGLKFIKERIKRLAALRAKNLDSSNRIGMNYLFIGNPGTGKTEVARMLADEFFGACFLFTNKVTEISAGDLIGEYTGQTIPKVRAVFEKALGGVLLIDEAYSLLNSSYHQECLSELNILMEKYRGQIAVIFAGYKWSTLRMIRSNEGLMSRINAIIEFPNYTKEELLDICSYMVKTLEYSITSEAKSLIVDLVEVNRMRRDFGNAREVRNVIERVLEFQTKRTIDNPDNREIIIEDVLEYQLENKIVNNKELCEA